MSRLQRQNRQRELWSFDSREEKEEKEREKEREKEKEKEKEEEKKRDLDEDGKEMEVGKDLEKEKEKENRLKEKEKDLEKEKETENRSKEKEKERKEKEKEKEKPKQETHQNKGVVFLWGRKAKDEEKEKEKEKEKESKRVFRKLFGTLEVSLMATGGNHLVFLTSCGRVFVSGSNSSGQLGVSIESTTYSSKPLFLKDSVGLEVDSIVCGPQQTGLIVAPTLIAKKRLLGKQATINKDLHMCGFNPSTQKAVDRLFRFEDWKSIASKGNITLSQVVFGETHVSVLVMNQLQESEVWSWGFSSDCLLGFESTKVIKKPHLVSGLVGKWVSKLSIGSHCAAAVTKNGKIYLWGDNVDDCLGIGIETSSVPNPTLLSLPGIFFVNVSCGHRHTLAVASDGTVYSWGKNENGQLGIGSKQPVLVPTSLPDKTFNCRISSVTAGFSRSMAISKDGRVFLWGSGADGMIDPTLSQDFLVPQVISSRPASVVIGNDFTCAVFPPACPFASGNQSPPPGLSLSLIPPGLLSPPSSPSKSGQADLSPTLKEPKRHVSPLKSPTKFKLAKLGQSEKIGGRKIQGGTVSMKAPRTRSPIIPKLSLNFVKPGTIGPGASISTSTSNSEGDFLPPNQFFGASVSSPFYSPQSSPNSSGEEGSPPSSPRTPRTHSTRLLRSPRGKKLALFPQKGSDYFPMLAHYLGLFIPESLLLQIQTYLRVRGLKDIFDLPGKILQSHRELSVKPSLLLDAPERSTKGEVSQENNPIFCPSFQMSSVMCCVIELQKLEGFSKMRKKKWSSGEQFYLSIVSQYESDADLVPPVHQSQYRSISFENGLTDLTCSLPFLFTPSCPSILFCLYKKEEEGFEEGDEIIARAVFDPQTTSVVSNKMNSVTVELRRGLKLVFQIFYGDWGPSFIVEDFLNPEEEDPIRMEQLTRMRLNRSIVRHGKEKEEEETLNEKKKDKARGSRIIKKRKGFSDSDQRRDRSLTCESSGPLPSRGASEKDPSFSSSSTSSQNGNRKSDGDQQHQQLVNSARRRRSDPLIEPIFDQAPMDMLSLMGVNGLCIEDGKITHGFNQDLVFALLFHPNPLRRFGDMIVFFDSFYSFLTVDEIIERLQEVLKLWEVHGVKKENVVRKDGEYVIELGKYFYSNLGEFCQMWLERFSEDNDAEGVNKLVSFVQDHLLERSRFIPSGTVSQIKVLLKSVNIPLQRANLKSSVEPAEDLSLLEFDPTSFAEEVTIYLHSHMQKVEPKEVFGLAWTKTDADIRAPHLTKMINFFNKCSRWAVHGILSGESPVERAARIEHVITILTTFLSLNNLHGALMIYTALIHSSIDRLKSSWAMVAPAKMEEHKVAANLFDSSMNWKNYRETLSDLFPPAVPYVGLCLQDLTFVEEGNQDWVGDAEEKIVNFYKKRLWSDVVQTLKKFQSISYRLEGTTLSAHCVLMSRSLSDAECYELSLKAEPRASSSSASQKSEKSGTDTLSRLALSPRQRIRSGTSSLRGLSSARKRPKTPVFPTTQSQQPDQKEKDKRSILCSSSPHVADFDNASFKDLKTLCEKDQNEKKAQIIGGKFPIFERAEVKELFVELEEDKETRLRISSARDNRQPQEKKEKNKYESPRESSRVYMRSPPGLFAPQPYLQLDDGSSGGK